MLAKMCNNLNGERRTLKINNSSIQNTTINIYNIGGFYFSKIWLNKCNLLFFCSSAKWFMSLSCFLRRVKGKLLYKATMSRMRGKKIQCVC